MRIRCPKCNKYSNNKKMICHNCSYKFIVPSFFEYNVLGKSFKKLISEKIFLILIFFSLIFPLIIIFSEYIKYHDYIETSGSYVKCVDFKRRIGCRGVYRYQTDNFIYYVKESFAYFHHKDNVSVFYNPNDITDAIIYSNRMIFYPIKFIFISYLFIVFGVNDKRRRTSL